MIALRANDGSSPSQFFTPGTPVPGEWQATASCPIVNGVAVGTAFQWQNVTPFGISSASDFLLDPPPALTSDEYAETYNEVMTVGSLNSTQRPPDRANVALFYAAASPTQVFNQVAEQVALEHRHSLSQNARALALINMAMSDSLVESFLNKYFYNFWRPETGNPCGRLGRQPENYWRSQLGPIHRDTVLSELSLKPRQCKQQRGGNTETPLRRRWTFDHVDQSRGAHHHLAIHFV